MPITRTFNSPTSGTQPLVFPANLDTTVAVTLVAAGAGGPSSGDGVGAIVQGNLAAPAPGDTWYATAGGVGGTPSGGGAGGAGGLNGGGAGGDNTAGGRAGFGGSGASDWRIGGTGLTFRVVIGGGAGATGRSGSTSGAAGNGGGAGVPTAGASGANGSGAGNGLGGRGGTQTAGGAAGGTNGSTGGGSAGALGVGGAGSASAGSLVAGGGGGGGGFYGGGAGGNGSSGTGGNGTSGGGGGGGGSSSSGSMTGVTFAANSQGNVGYCKATYSVLPDAAVLTAPANGSNFDVGQALPMTVNFTSDDTTDTLSTVQWQWRPAGVTSWTTSTVTPVTVPGQIGQTWNAPANTWASYVGTTIELQVRQAGASGAYGPWSASTYVTPRTAPGTPVVVMSPISSQTPTATVYPNPAVGIVTAQFRVLADDGAGNPSTVLATSGVLAVSGAPTSYQRQLPLIPGGYVNGVRYHAQARFQAVAGVWSPWGDTSAVGNINPPQTPVVSASVNASYQSVTLTIANPTPDSYPPAYNDIHRRDLTRGTDYVRIASGYPLNTPFTDWAPPLSDLIEYRVTAVTASGSTAAS